MQFLVALSEFGKDWKQIQFKIPLEALFRSAPHAQKYFKQAKETPKLYRSQDPFKDYFAFFNTIKRSPSVVFAYCQS